MWWRDGMMRGWWMPGGLFAWALALSPFIWLLVLFEIVLKGWALWKAARNGHTWWFVFLLVLNTAGILPIIYLFLYPEKKSRKK